MLDILIARLVRVTIGVECENVYLRHQRAFQRGSSVVQAFLRRAAPHGFDEHSLTEVSQSTVHSVRLFVL